MPPSSDGEDETKDSSSEDEAKDSSSDEGDPTEKEEEEEKPVVGKRKRPVVEKKEVADQPEKKKRRVVVRKRLDGGSVKKLKRRAGIERAGEGFNDAVRALVNQRLDATLSRAFLHMVLVRQKKTVRKVDVLAALRSMNEIMVT